MAEKITQTYATHVRLHPPFHFFVLPMTAAAFILAVINVFRHYDLLSAWTILSLASAAVVAAFLIRINALKAQDRVIRLEERLRLRELLNEPLRSRIPDLSESQLIAIRFASDGEVAGIVEKALSNGMEAKDIKKAIVHWRADTFRV